MIRFAKDFEPSSAAAERLGPEDRDAGGAQLVGHAGDERGLGPDDDEVDRFVAVRSRATIEGFSWSMPTTVTSPAMPALPGAAMMWCPASSEGAP